MFDDDRMKRSVLFILVCPRGAATLRSWGAFGCERDWGGRERERAGAGVGVRGRLGAESVLGLTGDAGAAAASPLPSTLKE